MLNLGMDFHNGYYVALEEVQRRLTSGSGRTEAYEETLEWIKKEIKNA